ncbi:MULTISPECIES: acyltransferase [unclassified Acinetobacter]|uniref:acyltransferase family protein n=1 Tax=unclassified Acinetobacter TaxID=196816 RepID=UPI002448E7D9|nr:MULTISPECIES: acyltransferase [unclassified Acinetobacter]MDH0031456.1 acyltransferase [Acinetobacter sp. GD04021]MDH0886799.1 acyltransferase [Acinetobacter sp. GD03873]MDH1083388.1 acyltransferase [Acinetobacter sp. GD03983]MDH2190115.1 acyltransferase [Acinetobacter sp. GD03645]MDH2203406.1 acyltransferase [Acinetobacter sp. GD03647]
MSFNQVQFNRYHSIDSLRFISIFLVLLHHFNIPYKLFDTSINVQIFGEDITTLFARNGNYGVTMFFVISGYLITSHTLKRWGTLNRINMRDFYISRFARIMPTMILLICLVNLLGAFELKPFMTQAPNGIVVAQSTVNLAALTFWMNILIIENGWVNYVLGVLWSLSVEEVFYLLFPLAALFLKRQSLFLIACVALILFCPYFRYLHYGEESGAYLYHYFSSFDGIAFGCLAALIAPQLKLHQNTWSFLKFAAISMMLLIYFSAPIKESCVWGISLFALGTAIVILANVANEQAKVEVDRFKFLQNIGKNSYEIYLFHLIILGFFKLFYTPALTQGDIKLVLLLIYLVLAIGLGAVIARYFSNPLNQKIRQRFIRK